MNSDMGSAERDGLTASIEKKLHSCRELLDHIQQSTRSASHYLFGPLPEQAPHNEKSSLTPKPGGALQRVDTMVSELIDRLEQHSTIIDRLNGEL